LQNWATSEVALGKSTKQFEEWEEKGTIKERRAKHAKSV